MPKQLSDALDDAIAAAPSPLSPLLKSALTAGHNGGNSIVEVVTVAGTAALRLTDADVAILVEALAQAQGENVFLRTLSLRNHRITDEGLAIICQKLVNGPQSTLRVLDVEGNDIEVKYVCCFLPK